MYLRALLVWIGMAVAMVVNGSARELLYAPITGNPAAQAISTVIGIAIILGISNLFVKTHPEFPHRGWVRVGVLWGCLTIVLELVVGLYVTGLTWLEILANYNLFAGRLWPLVLLAVFVAPVYWSRRIYRRRSAELYFRP